MKQIATALISAVVASFVFSQSPAIAQQKAPNVIRVALDGTGDFKTIQQALKEAPEGATVRVEKGVWNTSSEPLEITRPVTLEGESWETTRIVFAVDETKRPAPELLEVLQRISSELDAETREKVFKAVVKVYGGAPVLTVNGAKSVALRNLTFQRIAPVQKGTSRSDMAIDVQDAEVLFDGCAIVESPGTGLAVRGNSHVKVNKCLIANSWDKGISVAVAESGSFEITDSEIRNNRYAGLSIGTLSKSIRVQRCRIHSTGWHGIRYDGGSPVIEQNVFHRTAVSGIYASGSTHAVVRNNLFFHSGISCWFQNEDVIESNTFVGDRDTETKGGITQGMQVLGQSHPAIRRNLFVNCENGVFIGDINSEGPHSKATGDITLTENAFWNNKRNLARNNTADQDAQSLPLADGNLEQRPKFIDEQNQNFILDDQSPLAKSSIGATEFVTLPGPWPVQPEEQRTVAAVEERLVQTRGQR